MKQFRHVHISVSDGFFDAIEATGTGLAIYRSHNPIWERDEYYLIHLASGSRLLADFVVTLTKAGKWLRANKDLTDWTQLEDCLKPRRDLEKKVRLARLDIPAEEYTVYEDCL
ncbi:MAG TPA: hypothetical protein VEL72_06910 [Ktedonobacteraceae bacterium]|nr:hypothetical protein [Ktedonobacteraceae bacterium]